MKIPILKRIAGLAIFIAISWSCQKENVNNLVKQKEQAIATARTHSEIVAVTQDVADITSSALVGQGATGGRSLPTGRVKHDDGCEPLISGSFRIDSSHPDSIIYTGKFIIDFGDGTSCKDSTEVRKGKIIDSFVFIVLLHDSVSFSLTDSITFDGFQKDSVQLDGLFIRQATSWHKSTVNIQNARITYGDGTFMTWSGMLTFIVDRGSSHDDGEAEDDDHDEDNGSNNDSDDNGHSSLTKKVTGSIHGLTREGAEFSAEITKEILFEYACSKRFPVSGTIQITVAGVVSTLDYGDGTCDKKYTITAGGTTTEYTFKSHSGD